MSFLRRSSRITDRAHEFSRKISGSRRRHLSGKSLLLERLEPKVVLS
jgi:hypothetical protein